MNPNSEQWAGRADRPGKLNVLDVFLTVDGEANAFHPGTWSVFVRLSGCRVGCHWCDTKYSWSIKQGTLVSVDELVTAVLWVAKGAKKVTITGGEPLEQSSITLADFARQMVLNGFDVSVETAGSESVAEFMSRMGQCVDYLSMVVDYKLPSAQARKRFHWDNMSYLRHKKDFIKFVVADDYDATWMISIVERMVNDKWDVYSCEKIEDTFLHLPKFVASPAHGQYSAEKLVTKLRNHPVSYARQIGLNMQMHKIIWPEDHREEEDAGGVVWTDILKKQNEELGVEAN